MVDIGHLGPNEHISLGAKKNSHRNDNSFEKDGMSSFI